MGIVHSPVKVNEWTEYTELYSDANQPLRSSQALASSYYVLDLGVQ